jgi:hypothetical protein
MHATVTPKVTQKTIRPTLRPRGRTGNDGLPISATREIYHESVQDPVHSGLARTTHNLQRHQLLKVYGVSIYITTRLPRSLPAMIRTWISANQHEDLPGSLTALETALASRQQKSLT